MVFWSMPETNKCWSRSYVPAITVECEVKTFERLITEPAILKCSCGDTVTLRCFTNTCSECHTDYNMSGQALAPRSQWGEETGENVADILAIDIAGGD